MKSLLLLSVLVLAIIIFSVRVFSETQECRLELSGSKTSFSSEELGFIADFNRFIERVSAPLTMDEIEDRFFSFGAGLTEAKFIFFGENHVDYPSRVDQARALQALVTPDDIVFYEALTDDEVEDSDFYFYNLYIDEKVHEFFEAEGQAITSQEAAAQLFEKYYPVYESTRDRLNLHKLGLRGVTFDGWDMENSVSNSKAESEGLLASLTMRNRQMVSILQKVNDLAPKSRAFVIAGANHLPSGDLKHFKNWFSYLSKERQQFFGLIEPGN